MGASAQSGPESIIGIRRPLVAPTGNPVGSAIGVSDYNADASLGHMSWAGYALREPRFNTQIGSGSNVSGSYLNQDCGYLFCNGGVIMCDAAPSALGAAKIAAAQAATNGTPFTLAGASAGLTLTNVPFTVLPTGNILPTGTRTIESLTDFSDTAFAIFDPASGVSRCVSVTANAGATGGVVVIRGADLFGVPMTENITAAAASTVNGKKAFKYIFSATPQFTDAGHTYSVGTTDIFGLGLAVDYTAYTRILMGGTVITTTFVAAVTSTATATTGDVRGTIAPATPSDGTTRLVMVIAPSFARSANVANSYQGLVNGLFGVPQF